VARRNENGKKTKIGAVAPLAHPEKSNRDEIASAHGRVL
jgi:hypothetical protein